MQTLHRLWIIAIGFPAALGFGSAWVSAQQAKISNRYALLIGVTDYAEVQPLTYCGEDMRALSDRLVMSGFPADQVFLMTDKAAEQKYRPTRNNIDRQLKLVLGLADTNDLIVVGFSGHGASLNGSSYLCPNDTRLEDPQATMVPIDKVYDQLENCKASFKLMLVDACRNNLELPGRKALGSPHDPAQFAAKLDRPPSGIMLLSSCAAGQYSMEDKSFGHGVFMHFLLEGLAGKADPENSGQISLLDLYRYANRQTKVYVARTYNDEQTPSLKADLNDDFDITTTVAKVDAQPTPVVIPRREPVPAVVQLPRLLPAGAAIASPDQKVEIFLADADNLCLRDAATQSLRWRTRVLRLPGSDCFGMFTDDSAGVILATSTTGYRFDAATGKEFWRSELRVPIKSASAGFRAGEKVLILSDNDGNESTIDLRTGRRDMAPNQK